MEQGMLQQIHEDLEFLKTKVVAIELDVKEIKEEVEPEVREEYLERLKQLEQEKGTGKRFNNKEDFLRFLNEEQRI